MSERKWSEKQSEVIKHRDSDLIVSAAAGSGKTTVLVERILGLITDEENPVDIDDIHCPLLIERDRLIIRTVQVLADYAGTQCIAV